MSVDSNAYTFNRLSGYTSAADYQGAEGTGKSEQSLSPQLITANISTIAVHQTLSKQVMDDEADLSSMIEMIMRTGVNAKAEREIANGDGANFHIDGLVTQATNIAVGSVDNLADYIGQGITQMHSQGYRPDIVALDPSDWFTMLSEKKADGEYIGPGWYVPSPLSVYGVSAAQSAALPAGQALIIDSSLVRILDREQPTAEMSRETGNNFTENLVTILVEMRLGLAVYDLKAVSLVDASTLPA